MSINLWLAIDGDHVGITTKPFYRETFNTWLSIMIRINKTRAQYRKYWLLALLTRSICRYTNEG